MNLFRAKPFVVLASLATAAIGGSSCSSAVASVSPDYSAARAAALARNCPVCAEQTSSANLAMALPALTADSEQVLQRAMIFPDPRTGENLTMVSDPIALGVPGKDPQFETPYFKNGVLMDNAYSPWRILPEPFETHAWSTFQQAWGHVGTIMTSLPFGG